MDALARHLGRTEYLPTWSAMRDFTLARRPGTMDEFWVLEHPPVYTLGLAGRPEHVLDPGSIPVLACDRGGQVTYHGPGQVVVYALLDLQRGGWGVKGLVRLLEQAVLDLLEAHGVAAARRPGAPGIYVEGAKIAALGLRVRRGASYHGLALNVAMDLEPFSRINPCGYPGQAVTQLRDLGIALAPDEAAAQLLGRLRRLLGYNRLIDEAAMPRPAIQA